MDATLLHAQHTGPFLLAWHLEPYMVLVLTGMAVLYGVALRRVREHGTHDVPRSYPFAWYAGLLAFAAALIGPFDAYNDRSFALHMGQHVLLMLVGAPLLVLGRPVQVALWAMSPQRSGAIVGPVLRRRWVRGLLNVLANPLVVVLLININLVVWHLPDFYVAALENTFVHGIEHVMFLSTSLLFWWVIVDPVPRHHRVRPDIAIAMLFFSGTVGGLLALYLIFVPDVIYPFYLSGETLAGMSHLADQRVGGLVMLVAGIVVYFGATFLLIVRDYASTEPEGASPAGEIRHASD